MTKREFAQLLTRLEIGESVAVTAATQPWLRELGNWMLGVGRKRDADPSAGAIYKREWREKRRRANETIDTPDSEGA
jgi:hypothetical protein